MLDLKAGFHNIVFEEKSSYDSTFATHRGNTGGYGCRWG